MPIGPLWKIVALHCGVDPDTVLYGDLALSVRDMPNTAEWFYRQRLDLAIAHVKNGSLPCFEKKNAIVQSDIRLADYADWAQSMGAGHELPPQFPRDKITPKSAGAAEVSISHSKWPWGSYETPSLLRLAAAGERWRLKSEGGSYVPGDDSTAPKSDDDVVPWLIDQGVPKDSAVIMARMLKDPKVKSGPRTRPKKKKE